MGSPYLSLCIRKKAKGGPVFAEAFVQSRFLIPTVLVVVDVVISLGIGEVELHRPCQRTWQWVPKSETEGVSDSHLVWANTDNVACHRSAVAFALRMRLCSCRMSGPLTILRMQLDEFVTEGPIGYTLHVSLPVSGGRCERWSWELGEGVEVDIVDDRVYRICDEARDDCR
jgi:hypothetical protein